MSAGDTTLSATLSPVAVYFSMANTCTACSCIMLLTVTSLVPWALLVWWWGGAGKRKSPHHVEHHQH